MNAAKELTAVSPKRALELIMIALRTAWSVMLWGGPGTAKSAIAQEATRAYVVYLEKEEHEVVRRLNLLKYADDADGIKALYHDIRLLTYDAVDVKGVPDIRDGATYWTRPTLIPAVDDPCVVLLLEEISASAPMIQAAAYGIVYDRRVGEYFLPDYIRIIATGNGLEHHAVSHAMPTPLRTRLFHLNVEPDADEWRAWGARTGRIDPIVSAFVALKPDIVNGFDPAAQTFPCLRTLEMLSDFYRQGVPEDLKFAAYTGCVGAGAAAEFVAFERAWRALPDLKAIERDPHGAAVPDRSEVSSLYAVAIALAARATAKSFPAYWTYIQRLPVMFQVLCVREASHRNPEIVPTPAFRDASLALNI